MSAADADRDAAGEASPAKLILSAYRRMLLFLFAGASAIIIVLVLLIFVPYLRQDASNRSLSIFLVVVLAGTIGAFFSSLQRLYDFSALPKILYDEQLGNESIALFVYSLVPALVGAIAAAVLYLVFAGQMLRGSLFPEFNCTGGYNCTSFAEMLSSYMPKEATDYAKVILWGFVAGFAERMVPNLLNHFADDAEKDDPATRDAATGRARSSGDQSAGNSPPAASPHLRPVGPTASDAGNSAPTTASRGLANQG